MAFKNRMYGNVGLTPVDALDVDVELLSVALHRLLDLQALVVAANHLRLGNLGLHANIL